MLSGDSVCGPYQMPYREMCTHRVDTQTVGCLHKVSN